MVDINKLAVQDRVKKSYKESPKDPNETAARTCVENTESDPAIIQPVDSKNVKIYVLDIPNKNIETSQTLNAGTRRIIMNVRGKVDTIIRFAFVANDTDDGNDYFEIDPGGFIDLDKINFTGKTIYVRTDKDSRKIQIIELR